MDPNLHSAVAATIWDVLYKEVIEGDLCPHNDQEDAGLLAVRIAEKLERVYKINLGRRGP